MTTSTKSFLFLFFFETTNLFYFRTKYSIYDQYQFIMNEQHNRNITPKPSFVDHSQQYMILQDIQNVPPWLRPTPTPLPPQPTPTPPQLSPPQVDENNNSFQTNNQNEILWKGELYPLPPLQKVPSIEQALIHLKMKTHYNEHLDKATNEKEKTMITNVYTVLEQFVIENFAAAQSTIHVSNIVQSDKGVYIAHLDNFTLPKFGYSLNFNIRFKLLESVRFAAKIDMKLNDVHETIQKILSQDCPMLQNHQD